MPSSHSFFKTQQAWIDRLLPESILRGPAEDLRRARLLVIAIVFSAASGFFGTIVLASNGETTRAAFSFAVFVPVTACLILLRSNGRVQLAAHALCAVCALMAMGSVFVTPDSKPIPIGLMPIPIMAAVLAGPRASVAWTFATVIVMGAHAVLIPFSAADRSVLWVAAVVAGGCGLGVAMVEQSRRRAFSHAVDARAAAEADALERRAAERARSESEALFTAAFRRAPSLFILSRADTREILDVNESFVRISGWQAEEVLGKTLTDLNAWATKEDRDRLIQQIAKRGNTEGVELPLRKKSGELVWLLASAEILQLDGEVCLLAQGIDITQRKRSEEALARHREELEARFEERGHQLEESIAKLRDRERLSAVGTLAAGIAHQINNPIAGIVAASEFALLLEDDPNRDQVRKEALETALEESKRCGRIVRNVLKFARDEPTAKWVEDLIPTVVRASELSRDYVIQLGGELTVQTTAARLPVRFSPIDIEQLVLNLVRNAAESRRDGAHVLVRISETDGCAELSVSDDGDGIDLNERPRVFDPFYTSRIEEGGSGLGLSVAHGIVGDHAGKIEIQESSQGGTCVRVQLPLASDDDQE